MTDQQDVTTNTDSTAAEVVSSVAPTEGAAAVATKSAITINRQAMWYLLAFALVALMGIGLWFMLERDGRVQTTIFSGVTEFFKASQAAAVVNGAEISVLDFESTLQQLTKNTDQQGVDPTDETVVADLRNQAIESLVNTELLKQAALAANIEASDTDVEARYQQIAESLGGAEALMTRMEEFGVTEEMLRRDIRNDILIQTHIDTAVDVTSATVSEDEIKGFYDQVASSNQGAVPPLDEVRSQIEENLRFQKQQELVSAYVEDLRSKATIEVKI
jgi:hypothetical protein